MKTKLFSQTHIFTVLLLSLFVVSCSSDYEDDVNTSQVQRNIPKKAETLAQAEENTSEDSTIYLFNKETGKFIQLDNFSFFLCRTIDNMKDEDETVIVTYDKVNKTMTANAEVNQNSQIRKASNGIKWNYYWKAKGQFRATILATKLSHNIPSNFKTCYVKVIHTNNYYYVYYYYE